MDGKSLTPQEEKLKQLHAILPEAFTEGKVDWEKLQATLGKNINFANERYVLNWAGKSDAFKAMQQPSTRTLVPAKDESIDFDTTQNIFIEGENLEVLKILQKSYFGEVKMIYIDPPYNTGNDSFIYPDKFSETKVEYQKRVGDKDEEGYMTKEGLFHKNSKESGQYHSNWLNMMYPRLHLAKNLLRQDGAIFISIDENEAHNLRLVLNEVFGEDNFLASIVWEKRFTRSNNAKGFATLTETILAYRKSQELSEVKEPRSEKSNSIYSNPDNDPRGVWTSVSYVNPATKDQRPNLSYDLKNPITGEAVSHPTNAWKYEKSTYELHVKENRLHWGKDGGNSYPRLKRFLAEMEDGMVPVDLWKHADSGTTDQGSKELEKLLGGKYFDFPKPTSLLKRILSHKLISSENKFNGPEIVLDFFAGSAPTAQAVLELSLDIQENLQFVCVQLPEACDKKSEAYKAGYKTIADIAKDRIRKASEKLKQENPKYKGDLGFKVFKLNDSNFKQWQISGKDAAALQEQMKLFVDPVSKDASTANMVYELLLKSGKDLNSSIEKKGNIYLVNGNELALLLEKADQATIDQVLKAAPEKVIVLDRLFKDNDQLKTNTALQMKDAGIEFKTI